jgi:uncharacterized protein (TIRG00374 family)
VKNNKSRKLPLILSIIVSLGLIIYLFSRVDLNSFLNQFDRVNLALFIPYFIFYVALTFLSFYLRAIRWRELLPNGRELSLSALFDATFLGTFGNTVLPLRAGEFIRPWALSKWQPITFGASFAGVVSERVFDVFALMVCIGLASGELHELPEIVIVGARALGLVALIIAVGMIISYFYAAQVIEISKKCLIIFPAQIRERLLSLITEFVNGLKSIKNLKGLAIVIGSSLLIWAVISLAAQVVLWMFDIYPSFWVGFVTNIMVGLAVAAPSSPGFVGVIQAGCVLSLSRIYHYEEEFALAYSLLYHLLSVLVIVIYSLFVLTKRGLKLSSLLHAAEPENTST